MLWSDGDTYPFVTEEFAELGRYYDRKAFRQVSEKQEQEEHLFDQSTRYTCFNHEIMELRLPIFVFKSLLGEAVCVVHDHIYHLGQFKDMRM